MNNARYTDSLLNLLLSTAAMIFFWTLIGMIYGALAGLFIWILFKLAGWVLLGLIVGVIFGSFSISFVDSVINSSPRWYEGLLGGCSGVIMIITVLFFQILMQIFFLRLNSSNWFFYAVFIEGIFTGILLCVLNTGEDFWNRGWSGVIVAALLYMCAGIGMLIWFPFGAIVGGIIAGLFGRMIVSSTIVTNFESRQRIRSFITLVVWCGILTLIIGTVMTKLYNGSLGWVSWGAFGGLCAGSIGRVYWAKATSSSTLPIILNLVLAFIAIAIAVRSLGLAL